MTFNKAAWPRWSARPRSCGTSSTACRRRRDRARRQACSRRQGAAPVRPRVGRLHAPLPGAGPRAEPDRRQHPQAVQRRADRRRHRRAAAARVRRAAGPGAPQGRARLPRGDVQARPLAGRRMSAAPRPYTLVAELTYACPLHCVYCSNPVDFARHHDGLDTDDWRRVLREAEQLGVVQVNFTGGEPLLRPDLESLVEQARALDLYTNLITSGIPLERGRLARLRRLGLDNVQVSIQDARPAESDRIAGYEAFEHKLRVARWVKELGFPLTVNTVLHRGNLDRIGEVIGLAEELRADRLELANAQYLGWALLNRRALLPTRSQLERARSIAAAARGRLADATERTSGVVALTYRTREASREKAAAGLSAARPAPGA